LLVIPVFVCERALVVSPWFYGTIEFTFMV